MRTPFVISPLLERIRSRAGDEAGLSLIEVVVTALMVALIAAGTATALIATTRASAINRFRSEADALAAQDLDQLRGLSDEQLNALQDGSAPRSHQETFQGITFTVTSGATFSSGAAGGAAPGCTTTDAAFYKVTSTVSWTAGGYPESIEEDSLLERPVIGQLLVQVADPSNAPLSGVSITASGASRQSAQTNASGCTIFAGLTPGDYSVTLSKPGYVDVNGRASPVYSPVGVGSSNGGQLTGLQLGQISGPINATFQAATGGAGGEANGLSWSATGMASPGVSTSATATTASSTNSLYPTSYAVWGGRCPGQEPPSGSVANAQVGAGQSVNTTVKEPLLSVSGVTDSTTTTSGSFWNPTTATTTVPVRPSDVVLRYSDGTCTDTWSTPVSPATGTTAPATGWLLDPGQPYAPSGDLSVCVDYNDPATGYHHATATTGNTSFSTANTVATINIAENTSSKGPCPTS